MPRQSKHKSQEHAFTQLTPPPTTQYPTSSLKPQAASRGCYNAVFLRPHSGLRAPARLPRSHGGCRVSVRARTR